eukprot:143138-Amorphochlora_amoeboformis.AAC.3
MACMCLDADLGLNGFQIRHTTPPVAVDSHLPGEGLYPKAVCYHGQELSFVLHYFRQSFIISNSTTPPHPSAKIMTRGTESN